MTLEIKEVDSSEFAIMEEEEEDALYLEVEDIMCDQCIITTEINWELKSQSSVIAVSATRIRVAVAVLARTVLPTVLDLCYACLRNQKTVVDSVRRQLLPTVLAFLANSISRSLASVQRGITFPLSLRAIRHERERSQPALTADATPEKSVECIILAGPDSPEEIQADVIFVHGLHGGLGKTWRQGEWRHEGHKLKHEALERSASEGVIFLERKKSLKRSVSEADSLLPKKAAKVNENECVSYGEDEDEFGTDAEIACTEGYSDCWPRDWLPVDCPGVRVIALNYTTDVLWRPVWIRKRNRTDLVERSKEMIDELLKLGVGKQPIVWVGHSKGGLFIKQILLNAYNHCMQDPILSHLYQQTKVIMFYSVPHRGSSCADYTLPFLRKSVELTEVQRNCNFVLDLHCKFLKMLDCCTAFNPEIFSFIETAFTFMSFVYIKIVAFESADPGVGAVYGVPLDHREICKPAGRDCFLYTELVKMINRVVGGNAT